MKSALKIFVIGCVIFSVSKSAISSEISEFAKSILYAENGEYEKANLKISPYEITDSAIVSIIRARVLKDETLLLNKNFKALPDIKDKIQDRINYEIAKILFEKGDIQGAKDYLMKIKENNFSSWNFLMANISVLEGNNPNDFFAKVNESEIDDVSFKTLKNSIDERFSNFALQPKLQAYLFFGTPGLPVIFEGQNPQKKWDIISEFFGSIKVQIIPNKKISPFLSYDFAGEFYTEIYGFTVQKISVGAEYLGFSGISYSAKFITYGPEIFAFGHVISPFIFPRKNIYASLFVEIDSFDKVKEREGFVPGFDISSLFSFKAGRTQIQNISGLTFSKRFGSSPQFSELGISLRTTNQINVSDIFSINFDAFGMLDLFPEKFEDRSRNISYMITIYPSIDRDFVRWEIIKPSLQQNISDSEKFSWSRFIIGTSLDLVF